ncbi:uncharacterized protein [Chanodichthys erythropterus]|uniref:uncharacterized protein isoform X4 n=1 Tax=Chanodichthys erythropterus TaxID=933992 RepID=UPI00351DE0F6
MEKFIFFCVICFGNMQITSSDASVRGSSDVFRAQIGEDITLNCSMRHRYEVAWYHLRSEELVLLISAEKDEYQSQILVFISVEQNRTLHRCTSTNPSDWRISLPMME